MRPHRLGNLQFAILSELWRAGEATVAEVHERVGRARGLALTTIGTMLRKMEARGLVRHRTAGRVFVYRPAVREQDVGRSMIRDVVERLFEGNRAALVSQLLREGDFDPNELNELRALIEARQAELRRKRGGRDG
ncbi:MAG TPA: BlaI/MecI/CopY family transcriptional regulator [Planctomycetota bacterium]|nr:BlaI/MecI/CopY family transcriptional regulator [Planctomycetota bacterium]